MLSASTNDRTLDAPCIPCALCGRMFFILFLEVSVANVAIMSVVHCTRTWFIVHPALVNRTQYIVCVPLFPPAGARAAHAVVSVAIEGQVVRPTVAVTAQITHAALCLSTNVLKFGRVSIFESAVASVTLTNPSAVCQRFGFVDVPAWVALAPGNGFGEVLPHASVTVDVVVSPTQHLEDVRDRAFDLTLACVYDGLPGRALLRCTGITVVPPLRLSCSRLTFGAVAPGSEAVGHVALLNTTSRAQHFAFVFGADEHESVEVFPSAGRIAPGASQPVYLLHRPSALPARAADEGITASGGGAGPPAPQPLLQHVRVNCISSDSGESVSSTAHDPQRTVGLDLFLATVPAAVTLTVVDTADATPPAGTAATPLASDAPARTLDFGEAPVGSVVVRAIMVQNISAQPQTLSWPPLDPAGAFHIANPVRVLQPGAQASVRVAFSPQYTGAFFDRVGVAYGGASRVTCALRGRGQQPALEVLCGGEPVGATLALPPCLVGAHVSRTLTFQNPAPFAVDFTIVLSSTTVARDTDPPSTVAANARDGTDAVAIATVAQCEVDEHKFRGTRDVSAHPLGGFPLQDSHALGATNVNGTSAFAFQPPRGRVPPHAALDVPWIL